MLVNSLEIGYVSRLFVTVYMMRISDSVSIMFLSDQSRVHIYIYIYACAGTEERKTRSWPLRAVRLLNSTPGVSRLLTRAFPPPPATRWRQASPPFDPAPPPRPSTTRKRDPHPGIVVGRSRGSDPSTSSIDGNLTADRKARLPLRSSAKIAMKASRHLESFSSLLIPLV